MNRFISKELIEKGWSGDKKYCATDEAGKNFLLRVSPIEEYDRKKNEFELMCQVAALNIPMCLPIEFGVSEEGVYSIQSWINGIDAESEANKLSDIEQYSYGYEAGQILKKIHTICAPSDIEEWDVFFNRKMNFFYKIS